MQAANSESSHVFPHSIITALTSCSQPEQETPDTGLGDTLGSLEDKDSLGSLDSKLENSLGRSEDSLGSLEDGLCGSLGAGAGSEFSLLCRKLHTTPMGFMRWHMQS